MTRHATGLVERIWDRDPTVWTGDDEARWLGWLDEPARMREQVDSLFEFAEDIVSAGAVDDTVLLGMGGSSLAPEVLRRAVGAAHFHLHDTTQPAAIRRLESQVDPERTLVESLGLERLPAFVHLLQDTTLVAAAEGWDPREWQRVAREVGKAMAWTVPEVTGAGDPRATPGWPA